MPGPEGFTCGCEHLRVHEFKPCTMKAYIVSVHYRDCIPAPNNVEKCKCTDAKHPTSPQHHQQFFMNHFMHPGYELYDAC